ncbi:MAG: carboxypeptidase-like regulatory domain-containing protein [Rhodothermales bacterium]
MHAKGGRYRSALVMGCALLWAATSASTNVSSFTGAPPEIDEDDIGGVVAGPDGPEAGVWVIAETDELPTPFARIVVTDDQGRYVLPDLPSASYSVWVRGYGLVDSPKVQAEPGSTLDLTATPAPSAAEAAAYYPAGYWFSLLQVPEKSEFPGTGPEGNGIFEDVKTQAEWLRTIKSGTCTACHQLGNKATRELHPDLGTFASSEEAWERRLQSGQAGGGMIETVHRMGRDAALGMFADWTDRIAAGALPPEPPRPEGVERNVVITLWDWADPTAYLHDLVSTDRRDPTVNGNGPLYGALEASADYLPVLDPTTHTASRIPLTVRDPDTPVAAGEVAAPSPYWGDEAIWTSKTNVHNPMFDELGRVWITAAVRPPENPDVCKEGSDHPSAKLFPLEESYRHLGVYDPKTEEYTHLGTCFSTHHLMFAEDENHTLWTSGGGPVIGWLNRKMFDETGDEEASQGWTAFILDTNGNGKRDDYVEPDQPTDSTKDKRYGGGLYAVAPAPDGSVWGTKLGYPGAVIRLDPGANLPETALTEVYELPLKDDGTPVEGFSPRGGDVDRNGVYWAALASGHLASFDRRKCEGPLNGPEATGQHCPEGWTFYAEPLPQMQGVTGSGSAEGSYYTWVDQFNTLGLGENVPINTGNGSEGLLALKDGEWVVLRVPYPLGFYTKWMDGRIDDPDADWKGRGLWATVSTRAPFHMEGGKGTTSKVAHFQLRPDPLAK